MTRPVGTLASRRGGRAVLCGVGLSVACAILAVALWAFVSQGFLAGPVIGWFLALGIVRLYTFGARRLRAGGIVFVLALIAVTVVAAAVVGFGNRLITQEAEAIGLDPWPLRFDPAIWTYFVLPSIPGNSLSFSFSLLVLSVFAALGAVQSIHWQRKAARAKAQPLVYGPMNTADMLTIAEFGDPEHRAQLARRRKLPPVVTQMLAPHAPQGNPS